MSDVSLLATLEQLGLSDKEARVYYAALRLGPSTVLQISRQAAVKRSTAYSVIESLKHKRLLRKVVYGIKEFLEAESPENLGELLQERQNAFQAVLPKLNALHLIKGDESVVKYYEGIEQVKQVYLGLIKTIKIGQDYMVLSNIDAWHNQDPEFFDDFAKKRGRLDIRVRMALEPSEQAKGRKTRLRQPNEETRLLPLQTKLSTNLVIIPQRVMIQQLKGKPMAMVIENKQIIQMHREMFELIWSSLAA